LRLPLLAIPTVPPLPCDGRGRRVAAPGVLRPSAGEVYAPDAAQLRRGRAFAVLWTCLGLSQKEVGKRATISESALSEYSHGKRVPDAKSLERLFSKGLDLPLNALQDAENFVDYIHNLKGHSGGWQELLRLRQAEGEPASMVAEPQARYGTSTTDRRLLAAAMGHATTQALLRFLETLDPRRDES